MKRECYDAPELKAVLFRAEKGYAASEQPGTSTSAKITMLDGSL
ncbi:MAG: hypothetical protein Q4F69_11750 [Bacteroidia bacterium]|nr:hypothetical protein [Bacteroidia bacterium]